MKILVVLIVYNRFDNLKRWINCWKACNTNNAELIVIHNVDTPEDIDPYREICRENHIIYYSRENIGMDIGAFQDICRGRLILPEWDYLLWVTDDVFPMSKDFITDYTSKINNLDVICLEISREVKTHIRTTGFLISSKLTSYLEFPADPITTKRQCYLFEHASPDAFYEQVLKKGSHVVQVTADTRKAPLWDSHNRHHFKRWQEHYNIFPE